MIPDWETNHLYLSDRLESEHRELVKGLRSVLSGITKMENGGRSSTMTTFLRELYDVLSCFSTATHTEMCNDLLRKLKAKSEDNLAGYFAAALEVNQCFNQSAVPFIPATRGQKSGTNPVTDVMAKASPLVLPTSSSTPYEFTFLEREIPHLRAMTKAEQDDKAWIDYVAVKRNRPILGEVKWEDDKNSFYAFIQLLTYLSEMAIPNQIERSLRHHLFGRDVSSITAFDLHIFLANFNDRGKKGPLIELTRQLASAFKQRLQQDHPEAATCFGDLLCIRGVIDEASNSFSEVKCLWIV